MVVAGIGWTIIDIRGRFRNEKQCIETAKLLLAAGADVNAANATTARRRCTAPRSGAGREFARVDGRGAERNLDVKDRAGSTPLDIAMGKTGTTGRAGVAGAEPHPETAAALRELLSASTRN